MAVDIRSGLRDVVVGDTSISTVDGAAGELRYRGYEIADLASNVSFEEVAWLLWMGDLPDRANLERFAGQLGAARTPPREVLAAMAHYPRAVHPLEALRTAVSHLAMFDPDARDNGAEANRRKSLRLAGQIATLIGAWRQIRDGRTPLPPDAARSHASDFMRMLTGTDPDQLSAEAMDAVLVLQAEHELNASTFAARVTTATFSDLHSAVTSAIGALKGPRHGGANEDVLAMLEEIGTPERAGPYIRERLAARERMSHAERAEPRNRIPGWGHPVYKVDDPRAPRLRAIAQRLASRSEVAVRLQTAEEVYGTMKAETEFPVNVDFFSAVIYYALSIPIDLCTSIFAASRIAGWCAHIMEQYGDRLIRPRAHYVGPGPRVVQPLDARG